MTNCYVYTLAYPDGTVFYVGKGTGNRINDHEREAKQGKKSYKCNVIRGIWKDGGQIIKTKVQDGMTDEAAYKLEIDLIRMYGREHLTNLTDGGEGVQYGNASGKRVSRDRIRLDLSLSEQNGLLDLAGRYLASQGIPDSNENIKSLASEWFYLQFGQWLKREIETNDAAMIV